MVCLAMHPFRRIGSLIRRCFRSVSLRHWQRQACPVTLTNRGMALTPLPGYRNSGYSPEELAGQSPEQLTEMLRAEKGDAMTEAERLQMQTAAQHGLTPPHYVFEGSHPGSLEGGQKAHSLSLARTNTHSHAQAVDVANTPRHIVIWNRHMGADKVTGTDVNIALSPMKIGRRAVPLLSDVSRICAACSLHVVVCMRAAYGA